MSDLEQQLQTMAEDLQELISLTAQNADKSNLNIVTRFENFEKKMEDEQIKRWSAFKWAVGIALLIMSILGPIVYMAFDKSSSQILVNSQRLSVIETNDKDQPSNKDIEKLVREREVKFKELEAKLTESLTEMKNHVSHKELGQLKTELYELVIRLHRRDKIGESK
jgi:hypothetical protein